MLGGRQQVWYSSPLLSPAALIIWNRFKVLAEQLSFEPTSNLPLPLSPWDSVELTLSYTTPLKPTAVTHDKDRRSATWAVVQDHSLSKIAKGWNATHLFLCLWPCVLLFGHLHFLLWVDSFCNLGALVDSFIGCLLNNLLNTSIIVHVGSNDMKLHQSEDLKKFKEMVYHLWPSALPQSWWYKIQPYPAFTHQV